MFESSIPEFLLRPPTTNNLDSKDKEKTAPPKGNGGFFSAVRASLTNATTSLSRLTEKTRVLGQNSLPQPKSETGSAPRSLQKVTMITGGGQNIPRPYSGPKESGLSIPPSQDLPKGEVTGMGGLIARNPTDIAKSPEGFLEKHPVSAPVERQKKEVDFTCQFQDDAGVIIATERAIRNPTAERNERGLQSKLAALKKELQDLKDINFDGDLSKIPPTLIPKLRTELLLEKEKEKKRLEMYTEQQKLSIDFLEIIKEIKRLDENKFPPKDLITQKITTLDKAIIQAEKELKFFQAEVAQTNATHRTTDASRYPFQHIAHRDLATKTEAEIIKMANELDLGELQKLLPSDGIEIGDLKLLTPEYQEGDEATYREEAAGCLMEIRDTLIPLYIKEFKASKEHSTPVLINSQLQTVQIEKSEDEVSSLGQSVAPSDFAHGEISLQELKDYQALLYLSTRSKYTHSKEELTQEQQTLIFLYNLENKDLLASTPVDQKKLSDLLLMIKAKAILSYGKENIVSDPLLKTMGEDPISTTNLWTGDKPLRLSMQKLAITNDLSSIPAKDVTNIRSALEGIELDGDRLHEINTKRELDLANLVLQDLEMHFESHPISTKDPLYARLSLLNLAKEGENKYGGVFNERTQGLDTFAALNFLDGKTIVFDVEGEGGSFIHPDGTIHMPKRCRADETITEATLSTAFFNVSIQKEVQNSGLQQSLNTLALDKLTKRSPPEHKKDIETIKKGLKDISRNIFFKRENPNVTTARQIIQTIKTRPDCHVSITSCEGKNETGAFLALMTKSALKESCSSAYKKMKAVWKGQLKAKIANANS